jgi:hypothetical protein
MMTVIEIHVQHVRIKWGWGKSGSCFNIYATTASLHGTE